MQKNIFALAFSLAFVASAYAEPGGTSSVSGPGVTRGSTKIEFRTTSFIGDALDGDWSHRANAGYGFTDWWRLSVIARASQPDGEDAELRSIGFENVFEFTPSEHWPVRLGGQFEYKVGVNGRRDEVELKLLAERRDGPLTTRFNVVGQRQVGSGASDEWTHIYALRSMWRANDAWALGVEGYSEPEERAHYLGPRASFSFGDASISTDYLIGFDEAQADGQFRIALEFSR